MNFEHLRRYRLYLLPFIGGLLFAAGFPMTWAPHCFLFSILGMMLFLQSLSFTYEPNLTNEHSLKSELLSLLCYSSGFCLMGFYWIPFTLKEFGSIPFPFNFALGLLFSVIIVPQYLVFILGHRLVKKFQLKSFWFVNQNSLRTCFLAFVFTFLDYYIPQQFPAHLGHTFLQLAPHIGLAPVLGLPAFSFFTFWFIFSIISKIKTGKTEWFASIFFAIFLIVNYYNPLKFSPDEQTSKVNNIRLVQANIGNFLKLSSESGKFNAISEIEKIYVKLSTRPSKKKIDIIFWPETAYPHLLNSSSMRLSLAFIPPPFKKTIEKMKAQLFVGGYDKSSSKNRSFFETEYNTTFFFKSNGQLNDVYYKHLLIPFGESLPFGVLNPLFAKLITNISYFAKGERKTLFKTENDSRFISAICYEILFSRFISSYLNSNKEQPHFLVNLTNDSWYGDTAEPYQHKFLAHWRALEFNIPIVRMTNTGVTSILYPNGTESKSIKSFKEDILDITLVTPDRKPTIFQRFGFLAITLVYLCITLFLFLIGKVISLKKTEQNLP